MTTSSVGIVPPGLAAGDLVYRTPPGVRFVRAEGVRLWDSAGRTYLDAEAANGAAAFGYRSDLMRSAVAKVADLPGLPSFCESELRVAVAQRLSSRFERATGLPGRVSFELGGAQGIEMALRIVAANRGRGPVMVFQGAYHGRSPFTAHLSASNRYRSNQPWPGPSVIRLPYPDCSSCPYRTGSGCNPACAQAVRRLGNGDVYGVPGPFDDEPVSALVVEPLLNVGGCVLPDSDHLRAVVDHARSLGALVVVDEIFTGMHRLGPEWGYQLHDLTPDIVVASKALTNGITPLSCVWAREPLADPDVFVPGSHSSTFAGNPLALAVTDVVLDEWDAWGSVTQDIATYATTLRQALEGLQGHPLVVTCEVIGALARISLTAPCALSVRARACASTTRPGLLLASTGMAPDTVILHPPLTATPEELYEMADLLSTTLDEVARDV